VKSQTKANALDADPKDKTGGESRLKLYQQQKPYRKGDLGSDLVFKLFRTK